MAGGKEILDRATETYRNLLKMTSIGLSSEEARAEALIKNLDTAISQPLLEEIGIGTVSDQLQRYKSFDAAYRKAVADELRLGVGNASTKNLLEAALNPNTEINLSLISNLTVRERLRDQFHFQVLDVGKLVHGARNTRLTHAFNKCPSKKVWNVFNYHVWWI